MVDMLLVEQRGEPPIESGEDRVLPNVDTLRILAERFARGEIDEDEYRQRRSALRG